MVDRSFHVLRAALARLEHKVAAQSQREEQLAERERLVAKRTAELTRKTNLLDGLFQHAPLALQIFDHQGYSLRMNEASRQMLGVPDTSYGVGVFNALTDALVVANGSAAMFARAYGGEMVRAPELTVNLADPHNSWQTAQRQIVFEQLIFPIYDAEGQVEAVVSCALDITARKQTELEIQRLNDELEHVVALRTAELQQAVEALLIREQDIRKLNEDLEARVVQRTTELEQANKELESFSYSVSHDLRAPLRAINGFSHALIEDYGDCLDAQGQQYVQRIYSATQRMSQLIDDMLSLAHVARTELRGRVVDLSSMAETIAAELQRSDSTRTAVFVIAPNVLVSGDAYLLRIALENLLANAWKFTVHQPAARIEFGELLAPQATTCYVRDNGAGFDMAYSAKLFGPFQRLHATHEFPGTGIGLATVQRIIHRHGGRVWAEGQVSQGATFYFTLPD